jgi:hypothetical protein
VLIVRKIETCPRCRVPTTWRLMEDCLVCERCQRKRWPQPARRRPTVLLCLVVILLAWLTFAFGAEAPAPDPPSPPPAVSECETPTPLPSPAPKPDRSPVAV